MTATMSAEWGEANRAYLTARIAIVRDRLAGLCSVVSGGESAFAPGQAELLEHTAHETSAAMTPPPALDRLCAVFDLTTFERDLLVICAAVEIDPEFARLCATAQGNPQATHPTFALALAALSDARWSALTPAGPLRQFRLIEPLNGDTLMTSPLRVDEHALHYLIGAEYLDDRLQGVIEPAPPPSRMPPSYRPHADRIVQLWTSGQDEYPIVQLWGDVGGDRRLVAAAACHAMGLRLHRLRAVDIPAAPADREILLRLWRRESLLSRSALLLDCDDSDPFAIRNAQTFAERLAGLLFVTGPIWPDAACASVVRIDLSRPPADEQRAMWTAALGPLAEELNGQLDAVVTQFRLDSESIHQAGRAVREAQAANRQPPGPMLWELCRGFARGSLDSLADRIEARARWEDLVLPDEQKQTLREIVAHVRQRADGVRGVGLRRAERPRPRHQRAVRGPSGTGKTMAAEVLARRARGSTCTGSTCSQVVSKYIGETEKNLRRVFDAAEDGGAMLLFDEADALFGKRSEVQGQPRPVRQHRGQLPAAADGGVPRPGDPDHEPEQCARHRVPAAAPVRRPVPVPRRRPARARSGERVFPARDADRGAGSRQLARLNVAGGNIRNIALNAAFLAADARRAGSHDPPAEDRQK